MKEKGTTSFEQKNWVVQIETIDSVVSVETI
jgi:hypothetical protein